MTPSVPRLRLPPALRLHAEHLRQSRSIVVNPDTSGREIPLRGWKASVMFKNGLTMQVCGALHAFAVGIVLGVVGLPLEVLAHRAPDLVRQAAVAFGA
jgi:hypothetical protein